MVNKQSTGLADYIGHIMVVDDDNITLKNVRRILEKEGHRVSTYNNPVRALESLEENCFDILLSDLSMPYLDGLELLEQAKRVHRDLEVIIITGFASLDKAVEATKKGAYHFLAKPFEPTQLREVVNQAIDQKRRRNMARSMNTNDEPDPDAPLIIGQSPQMIRVGETIAQVAPTDCNILLSGESGTGKELAAKAIHAQSGRNKGPLVAFNCASLNQELMENELFGHEKGAYTGAADTKAGLLEAAHGGTVFLDEIGEIPQSMQITLLRALQEREVLRVGGTKPVPLDVRIIAASARDLKAAVEQGLFRSDLYYRLNVVNLSLPLLAERKGDIPLLAYYFLDKFKTRMNKVVRGISQEAMELLENYAYPGNVRELMNIMERAVALCRGEVIMPHDLPGDLSELELKSFLQPSSQAPTLEELERQYVEHVLTLTGGVRSKAAEILGIDRVSLWRKLKKYGLEDA